MTSATDWTGRVGRTWAAEWQRTDRSFANLSPHLDAAIRTAAPAGPFHAIDIGCGAGATSLALADARPDATVTGLDLSADLIRTAHTRAGDRGTVTFHAGDAVAMVLQLPPADLIVSRHGVMFFADPIAAFTALRTAANSGARLVFSCFRDRRDNVWASDLIEQVTGTRPEVAPGYAPGPFGFADQAATATILESAGWTVDSATRIDFAYVAGAGPDPVADAADFFHHIGPLASALKDAADPSLDDRLKSALKRYAADGIVALPASAWIWRATATGEQP
ncbi:class I SAM-dependent methyltransferase [Sphingomonas sp. S6]|jgi:SAM-dependent methyltransferase|uniref:class I SAM-dependent methyltransferase n=1 Tax=Sphingomonas sp. S6 TaxID=3368600 RepID=UPI0028EB9120|nr:class I SAM-dependent methyltransferase [uncultured Sphingomonas sp.]